MNIEMKMPDLGTASDEIKVVEWLIEIGQQVKRGQPLLVVETDKSTMEVESFAAGELKEICVPVDESVAAGDVIAIIEAADSAKTAPEKKQVARPESDAIAKSAVRPAGSPKADGGGMFARNRKGAPQADAGKQSTGVSATAAQRVMANRMQKSKQTVPHFYLQTSVNAEPMIARRAAATGRKIAWDAFFVYAIGKALLKFDRMGCRYENEQLVPQSADAVGVAVDIEGELYVVAVDEPASKTPEQISDQLRMKVEQIHGGAPEAKRICPAKMTVTNLGMSNVESFTAIVNPPESAILAVGKVARVPVVTDGGELAAQNRVSITLSVDHRVVNGKYAADFLSEIVKQLEIL
jgi:pyruvate dehydrogenase E2 component (dihydrolipoamide acetyltransferase)